jgi:hypothetical protein
VLHPQPNLTILMNDLSIFQTLCYFTLNTSSCIP